MTQFIEWGSWWRTKFQVGIVDVMGHASLTSSVGQKQQQDALLYHASSSSE